MQNHSLVASVGTAICVVATVTCTPRLGGHETAVKKPSPSQASIPAPLSSAPASCPGSASPQPLASDLGLAIGKAPVWAVGFTTGTDGRAVLAKPGEATRVGYGMKVLWVAERSLSATVHVDGSQLGSRAPLRFQPATSDSQSPQNELVLDPSAPSDTTSVSPSGSRFLRYPSLIFIPVAGCYSLRAKWSTGYWEAVFASGAG
jgi:hypothetical protein